MFFVKKIVKAYDDFEEKKNRSGVRNEKKERKVKRTKDGSRQREKK